VTGFGRRPTRTCQRHQGRPAILKVGIRKFGRDGASRAAIRGSSSNLSAVSGEGEDVHGARFLAMTLTRAGRRPRRPAGFVHVRASRAAHVGGGPKQRTGGLLAISLCQRRRLARLRSRRGRPFSSCRHLCRSHSTRRKASGATRSATDQVRTGHQPQDRQGARPYHPGNAVGERR
jgi:hypothetical protein